MSVIFSRAPLRISLGGGGTDLPSYYGEHGGFLLSGSIDKYIYMLTHTVFQKRYRMKYSDTEEVDTIAEIKHPILRETLQRHWQWQPAGDRLGRRRARGHRAWAPRAPSPSACSRPWRWPSAGRSRRATWPRRRASIELDILEEPVGKQDQYVSAHGGICAYAFNSRRHGRRRAARARRGDARTSCATTSCSSTRARRARPPRSSPTRSSAPSDERRRHGREPPPHQGDGPREPRAAGVRRSRELRRADARALGEQARAALRG